MKKFMDKDFLLNSETALKLYESYAKDMPIFDYHCHLNADEIAEDKKYKNITEVWLYGDHYKWRLMRTNGVDEKYITGDASDKDKFLKWAETIPNCMGNPIYHWTHMELKMYFGIDEILSPKTAEKIWNICNDKLENNLSAKSIIKKSNVKAIFTTDEPISDLKAHKKLKDDDFEVKVLPTFRPDKFINIDKEDFKGWIEKLSEITNKEIKNYDEMITTLKERVKYFDEVGCKMSDHALDPIVYRASNTDEVAEIFKKVIDGKSINSEEIEKYKTKVLVELGREYKKYNWTMQLHIGVNRNNNTRMFKKLGPDTGFDSIADFQFSQSLVNFLDTLDLTDELPKTILYCLNPRDNEMLATIAGCFQGSGIVGKIQYGPAWWFNDQLDGMKKQIITLANYGVLSRFLGMLTDSRSFLSYTRHEYFRRLLCDIVGDWVEKGEVPNDMDSIGNMVMDICYNNANKYFI